MAKWLGRIGLVWLARRIVDVEALEKDFVALTREILEAMKDDKND